MNPMHQDLTNQIREAVRHSGLTYAQIAARGQMSENTVYRAMYGHPINTATLLRLLSVLRKTLKVDTAVSA
jgi:predicted transcriptional regulator